MYAIGCYDGTPPELTGYLLARDGQVAEAFPTLAAAEAEARRLNDMPHAPGRVPADRVYAPAEYPAP